MSGLYGVRQFWQMVRIKRWPSTDSSVEAMRNGSTPISMSRVIAPGESFSYTSGCPLTTPDGSMHGFYAMQDENGTIFDVEVPLFPLDSPYVKKVLH